MWAVGGGGPYGMEGQREGKATNRRGKEEKKEKNWKKKKKKKRRQLGEETGEAKEDI